MHACMGLTFELARELVERADRPAIARTIGPVRLSFSELRARGDIDNRAMFRQDVHELEVIFVTMGLKFNSSWQLQTRGGHCLQAGVLRPDERAVSKSGSAIERVVKGISGTRAGNSLKKPQKNSRKKRPKIPGFVF